jgi:hypothetical protein
MGSKLPVAWLSLPQQDSEPLAGSLLGDAKPESPTGCNRWRDLLFAGASGTFGSENAEVYAIRREVPLVLQVLPP